MSEVDFNLLSGGLDAASVARGVSAGYTTPNGGGSFQFAMHCLDNSSGVVGFYANQANFGPLLDDSGNATGGSVRGVLKRSASAGPTGFAPFLFIALQGASVNDTGYLLGLSDDDPHQIILAKSSPALGLKPDIDGVMAIGSNTFLPDTFKHLRLDLIWNPNGDAVLRAFENDLVANTVTAPVWESVNGIDDAIIDDALGINFESAPITGGYVGFGAHFDGEISRRCQFDQIEVHRQI